MQCGGAFLLVLLLMCKIQEEKVLKLSIHFIICATLEQLFKCCYIYSMKNKKEVPVCEVTYIDKRKVKKVEKGLPLQDTIYNTADILKTLGDPTRLKLVMALAKEELCVCDLSALTGVTISGISHQLRLLRSNRLVKFRREGKMVYYSLDDEHVENIVGEALQHVNELYK